MKYSGMCRPVDELGRIVIPKEIRQTLNIAEKDRLDVSVDGSAIVLRKCEDSCALCGASDELTVFGDKFICAACIKKLKETEF